MSRRDERFRCDSGVNVMESFLLSEFGEGDLNEFLDLARFDGSSVKLSASVCDGGEDGEDTCEEVKVQSVKGSRDPTRVQKRMMSMNKPVSCDFQASSWSLTASFVRQPIGISARLAASHLRPLEDRIMRQL